jgi:hypothetical protein
MNLLQMALTMLLSMKNNQAIYLPFEFVKYLAPLFFWDTEQAVKDEFASQITAYFEGDFEDDDAVIDPVLLKLTNDKLNLTLNP